MSFRRCVGLALDDAAPDHSTISRFRSLLLGEGLTERVFGEVTRQIDRPGLILRRGTMIDATLVEAQVKRPGKPKTEASEPDATADVAGEADRKRGRPPSRPSGREQARWQPDRSAGELGEEGPQAILRLQGPCGGRPRLRIIRRTRLTTASVVDTTPADELVMGDEDAVDDDKPTTPRRASRA